MEFLNRAFPEHPCDAIKMYSSVTINMNNEIAFSCWLRNIVQIFASWFPGGLTIAIRVDHVDRIEQDPPGGVPPDDNEPEEPLDPEVVELVPRLLDEAVEGTDSDDDATESSQGTEFEEEYEVESDTDGEDVPQQPQVPQLRPGQVIRRETNLQILCNIGRHEDF